MNILRQPPQTRLFLSFSSCNTTAPPTHVHIFTPQHHHQVRHATLLRRPLRPYTFTQLVTLSDGSTYTHRTTSPAPAYKSRKDTRNTPMWNPSSQKLLSVEADEAGKLRRFREKFGRGWDATASGTGQDRRREADGASNEASEAEAERIAVQGGEVAKEEDDNLMDLISGYGRQAEQEGTAAGVRESKTRSGKGKGGER